MDVEQFHQRLNELYLPPQDQFTIIEVPDICFMSIEGEGDPSQERFLLGIKHLFSMVHFIRPIAKTHMGKNFVEPPLECLYWAENKEDFVNGNKQNWLWKQMIVINPEWIRDEVFETLIGKVEKKLGPAPSPIKKESYVEGTCVQIMHVGDVAGVKETCNELFQNFLPQNKLTPCGPYHEIYLNDPNRVSPEKRKMVIRQPVKKEKR